MDAAEQQEDEQRAAAEDEHGGHRSCGAHGEEDTSEPLRGTSPTHTPPPAAFSHPLRPLLLLLLLRAQIRPPRVPIPLIQEFVPPVIYLPFGAVCASVH